jgi:hypothetical protein
MHAGWAYTPYYLDYLEGVHNALALKHVPHVQPRQDTLAGPKGRRADKVTRLKTQSTAARMQRTVAALKLAACLSAAAGMCMAGALHCDQCRLVPHLCGRCWQCRCPCQAVPIQEVSDVNQAHLLVIFTCVAGMRARRWGRRT